LTRNPLYSENLLSAKAASNLANALCNLIRTKGPQSADIEEAEKLARKAFRIMNRFGSGLGLELRLRLDLV
jgi:hypothetical protein